MSKNNLIAFTICIIKRMSGLEHNINFTTNNERKNNTPKETNPPEVPADQKTDEEKQETQTAGTIRTGKFDKNTRELIDGEVKFANGNISTGKFDKDTGILTKGTVTTKDNTVYDGTRDPKKKTFKGTMTFSHSGTYQGSRTIPLHKGEWQVKKSS